MPRKPKFKPEITRVKLNPEQAVLVCSCWWAGKQGEPVVGNQAHCLGGTKIKCGYPNNYMASSASS